MTRNGTNLLLSWPAGFALQTATDVNGPYYDIVGATPQDEAISTEAYAANGLLGNSDVYCVGKPHSPGGSSFGASPPTEFPRSPA